MSAKAQHHTAGVFGGAGDDVLPDIDLTVVVKIEER